MLNRILKQNGIVNHSLGKMSSKGEIVCRLLWYMVQIREEEHCSFVQSREGTLADLASPIMLVYAITRTEYHTDQEFYI